MAAQLRYSSKRSDPSRLIALATLMKVPGLGRNFVSVPGLVGTINPGASVGTGILCIGRFRNDSDSGIDRSPVVEVYPICVGVCNSTRLKANIAVLQTRVENNCYLYHENSLQ